MEAVNVFTCVSCGVVFATNELQRDHYRSEFHRYNLKRKVVGLPSVKFEEFELRITQQKKVQAVEEKTIKRCYPCNKTFKSDNTLQSHINSKKHEEMVSFKATLAAEEGEATVPHISKPEITKAVRDPKEEVYEDVDEFDIGLTDCLFCSEGFDTIKESLAHMSEEHSFFIPDETYLVDLEGLLGYLGRKLGEGHICLYCNERGKQFNSLVAVRDHMVAVGHCMINFSDLYSWEFTKFYDYSSSYPDYDPLSHNEERGNEVPQLQKYAISMCNDTLDLVLPSGKTLGSRELQLYYNQVLTPVEELESIKALTDLANNPRNTAMMARFQGISGKLLINSERHAYKAHGKWALSVGLRNNNQEHFRQSMPM